MITLFWVGKLGVLGGGKLLPLKYPRQSPVNTVHLPGADVHSGLNESQQRLEQAFYGAALAAIVLKWLQEGLNQTLACRAEFAFWG